jgi:hypothetical protein
LCARDVPDLDRSQENTTTMATRMLTLGGAVSAAAMMCYAGLAGAHQAERPANHASAVIEPSAPHATVSLRNNETTVTLTADGVPAAVLSDLRPSRLQVFENGVRQPDVRVGVEQLPISLAVLIEMGGRAYELNRMLQSEAPHLLRPLIDRLESGDSLAVFTYDDIVRPRIEFDAPRDTWAVALNRLEAPRFSEANLHDAAIQLLDRMQSVAGRRALVLVTTGLDTFSRATFDDLLARARAVRTPIYCLSLADLARSRIVDRSTGPLARVDWNQLDARCARLAEAAGGRVYRGARAFNAPAIFDDMLEQLRLRFVLSYESTATRSDQPRQIEVRFLGDLPARSRGYAKDASKRRDSEVIARIEYPSTTYVSSSSS